MAKTKNRNIKIQAFTMIELLVVIVLLSILSGVLLTVINPTFIKDTANYAVAEEEMRKFTEAVQIAQMESGKVLGQITGNYCSACAGGCHYGSGSIPAGCISLWLQALERVSVATGGLVDLSALETDPWGNPYILDENELEPGHPPCRLDSIKTAGPDGLYGTSDDRTFNIPFSSLQCAN